MYNLEYLILDRNHITIIPFEITKILDLEWLDCSHNNIKKLSSLYNLRKLHNFRRLEVYRNRIIKIPEFLSQSFNKKLKLDFTTNSLTKWKYIFYDILLHNY